NLDVRVHGVIHHVEILLLQRESEQRLHDFGRAHNVRPAHAAFDFDKLEQVVAGTPAQDQRVGLAIEGIAAGESGEAEAADAREHFRIGPELEVRHVVELLAQRRVNPARVGVGKTDVVPLVFLGDDGELGALGVHADQGERASGAAAHDVVVALEAYFLFGEHVGGVELGGRYRGDSRGIR